MISNPLCPTLAGFQWFLYNVLGVTESQLPPAAEIINYVFSTALARVSIVIQQVSPTEYTTAVYNLATDLLINFAPDQGAQTFFKDLRTKFGIGKFIAGVVSSSGDEGSSTSINVIQSLNNLTILDLNNLKTPYGQQYLGISQQYGTVWGIS